MDIQLIEITDECRAAVLAGADRLSEMTGLSIPAGWPVFPEIFARPASAEWPLFLFVHQVEGAVVGSGGFLGSPDDLGRVQIGYEVAADYRGRGIATRAMQQVLSLRPDAQVVAVTEQAVGASASVLSKLGLVQAGTVQPPGSPRMYLWVVRASAA